MATERNVIGIVLSFPLKSSNPRHLFEFAFRSSHCVGDGSLLCRCLAFHGSYRHIHHEEISRLRALIGKTLRPQCRGRGGVAEWNQGRRLSRTMRSKSVPKTSPLYEALFRGRVGSLHCFAYVWPRLHVTTELSMHEAVQHLFP